ncbi:MAG: AraC family transcriptional regulator ligand-binding domain-containing protein [Ottowia sp.]|uniref:AraC family transcriptional regulator n=1 Tax=Ottowia sp. TaxID=1898956 RepID=UPI003C72EE2C
MRTSSKHIDIVRAAGLTGFVGLVRELGADPVAILHACGLGVEDLKAPDRYLPYRDVVKAIEMAARVLDVRDFGLRMGALQRMEILGPLGLVIQSGSSVREGMLLGAKYVHFHTPALGYRFTGGKDAERMEVLQLLPDLPEIPQTVEICVDYLCRIMAMLSNNTVHPTSIHLRHARQGTEAQYRKHLGQIPHFNDSFDGISVAPLAWRHPMAGHSPLLQNFVERFLLGLSPAHTQSAGDQVRQILHNVLRAGMTDLATVAQALGQHPRTLQRRLQAEGLTFEDLRDGARKTWAGELLSQPKLSLAHIAHLMGFADQSVFTRACQRWFGESPRGYRLTAGRRNPP